jgi:hypothetical protein
VKARGRFRMHGGAAGSGAPKGKANGNYKRGRFTEEAIAERGKLSGWLAYARAVLKDID